MSFSTWAESIVSPFAVLFQHRVLTWELAKREITDRYVGQMLGVAWAIGHPLMLVAIYIVIFQYVFKARIGSDEAPLDYPAFLLSGLLPWLAFQESMSKGASVIVGNSNLVKQVVFPLEVLPVKAVLSSWVTQAIGTGCLIIYVICMTGALPWTFALLPALWVIQMLGMIGVSYFLATIGVYVRDCKDIVQVFCTIGIYLMPIVYAADSAPPILQTALAFNPFSHIGWCYQDACFHGQIMHPWSWILFTFLSCSLFYFGFWWFRKVKVHFGSVL